MTKEDINTIYALYELKDEMIKKRSIALDMKTVFENAKQMLINYLAVQGVFDVLITLSADLPQQNQNSGKFKHIINMQ